MKTSLFFALVVLAALAIAAVPAYKISTTIKIGGEGRWDDLYVDSANHRLYVSHNSQVEVIDTVTDKLVGTIPNTPVVHGIAVAADLGKGFITTGAPGNKVIVFDLVTLKATGSIAVGQDPDAISYDSVTHRVVTMNHRSSDATIIDAKTGEVVKMSLPLGGKPAFSVVDGKGHVYANIENRDDDQEMVEITVKDAVVSKHYATDPCDDSSGLAIDTVKMRLYTACANKMMVVSDPVTGKVLATPDIGAGPDSIAFDDGYAFTPNGQDGTITMVGETSPGKFVPVATIPMAPRARIIGADTVQHKLYVPAADYGPGPATGRGRAPALADTFKVVVYSR
jgi:DNA-binding beta-propeller fold protein YncE